MYNPKRGDQVMVSPHVSGPAAGRPGCASGNRRDGHFEILDRHPDQPGAQLLGWFESDDLLPMVTGPAPSVAPMHATEIHLHYAEASLALVREAWQSGKLRDVAEGIAIANAHAIAAALWAGAPMDAYEAKFDKLCNDLPNGVH